MPTLLETEQALRRSLVEREDSIADGLVEDDGVPPRDRLELYRNNFIGAVTTALRLSFPAALRLVGEAFFESAARIFIEQSPPCSACLNDYGADFPAFMERFPPAGSVPYLPQVMELEWAVNAASHAPDAKPLDLASLAAIAPDRYARVIFVPHPSVRLVRATYPVDLIRKSVLDGDDAAMAAIDPVTAPVQLLVGRRGLEVNVERIGVGEASFVDSLCRGMPLEEAVDGDAGLDVASALAGHFEAGRFVDFAFAGETGRCCSPEAAV